MTSFFFIIIITILAVIMFKIGADNDRVIRALKQEQNELRNDIKALQESVNQIGDRVLLTREQRRVKWWDGLPDLDFERFKQMAQGSDQEFIMIDGYSDSAEVTGMHYTHERLEFRTEGEKDAVAYGKARPWATVNDEPVEIAFNQHTQTAKLIGPFWDSRVKFSPHRMRMPD